MIWVMASLFVILMLAVGFALYYFYTPKGKKKKMKPYQQYGMAAGALVGSLVGIALVEFFGYDYPSPFILMFLGMAAGQVIGLWYGHKKKK